MLDASVRGGPLCLGDVDTADGQSKVVVAPEPLSFAALGKRLFEQAEQFVSSSAFHKSDYEVGVDWLASRPNGRLGLYRLSCGALCGLTHGGFNPTST